MMRFVGIVALAAAPAIAPFAAQAQQAWGDAGGCARVAGEPATSDMVFILWPDRIERWESACRIIDMTGDLDTRLDIKTQCTGEGATWEQAYVMAPNRPDTYAIWPVDAPDFPTELRLCE